MTFKRNGRSCRAVAALALAVALALVAALAVQAGSTQALASAKANASASSTADASAAASSRDASAAADASGADNADCAGCHDAEFASLEDGDCLASTHANVECVVCHAEDRMLEKVHDGVSASDRMPTSLSLTEVDDETCLGCHGSYDDLAAQTADSTALTDANGTVVNPHQLPQTESHEDVTCVDCHHMHEEGDAASDAMSYCSSCHHKQVFECGTCHAKME